MFRSKKAARKAARDDQASAEDVLVVVERAVHPYIVTFHDPASFRSEQFRSLRNKLVAMNPDGAPKTLVVTSAIKGEGKSVTAINLAHCFAELERTPVLLVDADLRTPSVERYLNLNEGPGLADLLLGRATLEECIRPRALRGLDVVGAGSRLVGPSEVLVTPKLDELLERLKERYQYVIIDTPPVLPSTDATVMAARADGTLLVVRLEHSSRSMTRDAIRQIQDLGGNILGSFVTEVRGPDPERDPRLSYLPQTR